MSLPADRVPRPVVRTLGAVRAIVGEFRSKNVPFMAGSIAYAAFVSVLPLFLLLLLAATAIGGRALASDLLRIIGGSLSPTGAEILTSATTRAAERAGVSIIGFVVLVWGLLRVFRGLDTAFSVLYGAGSDNGLRNQVRDGIVVFVAMGLILLAMVGAGASVARTTRLSLDGIMNGPMLVVGLSLGFLPMYYVFPDADVPLREALPGSVVAATGWSLLEGAFGVYVSHSATADLYGLIGGIVLLITWFYFASLAILLGAVTNVVVGRHERSAVTGTG